jgi:hypothetical protein
MEMTDDRIWTPETLKALGIRKSDPDDYSPSAFKKRFGSSKYIVTYVLEPDSYLVNYMGYSPSFVFPGDIHDRWEAAMALVKEAKRIGQPVLFFTGIHSESDWSRTKWWALGQHLVNRSGEYAVVLLKPGTTRKRSKKSRSRTRMNMRHTSVRALR